MQRSELSAADRAWLDHDAEVWKRAHAIAARHPGVDAGDVRHVLYNLERSPSERLARSLNHARLGSLAR
jgi:hypothetical protein